MEIIDAHAHIYPVKIAEKATGAIGQFYDIEMEMPSGTTTALLENGKKAGINKFIVHSCATKTHQVRSINEFIKSEIDAHAEFIGFMTLHPDMTEEQIFEEVKWCKQNGFKGVKLHPDFQKFYIDDENMKKFYRGIGDNFPILLHIGDNRYDYSRPFRLMNIAKEFKNVSFIAAHFGGYRRWDEVNGYKGLDNVFFDTCSSLEFITKEQAVNIIDKLGSEKFFFGTDFPMWDASEELERFDRLNLSSIDKEKILSKNVKNLLKML